MKRLTYILLIVAMTLTACHDNDIIPQDNGGGEGQQTFINFATRAGNTWDDVLLPGQKYRAVVVGGKTMLVPQSIGIYGFLMDENYEKVLDVDKQEFSPVFNNDVLKEYDRTESGNNSEPNELEPDVLEQQMEDFKEEQWENLETEEFGEVTDPETGARENLFPVDKGTDIEGSITQPNGEVTDRQGQVIIEGTEENPDNPDNPIVTEPPYGTVIAGDGTVELADGTKITADAVYRRYIYVMAGETTSNGYEVPIIFHIFRNASEDRYKIEPDGDLTEGTAYPDLPSADDLKIEETTDNNGKVTITFPDGTVVTREKVLTQQGESADGSPITQTLTRTTTVVFPMTWYDKQQNQYDIQVSLDCISNTLTFLEGNDRTVFDLTDTQKTETNPARQHAATRATDIPVYDDDYDRYYWGYNAHRWTSGHYMFYAYSPASQHVDLDYNKDGSDIEREKGTISKFTWGKIPSISNTDYIVAKNEVWKYNDPTRVHFDAMDHLMSRIRVAFAVHPDFHKIRRVVVTNVSITILEPGFNRIYEYSNHRDQEIVDGGVKTGVTRVGDAWKVWQLNGQDFLYNPAKNPATYAENVQERPEDAIQYATTGKYGKLLYPLATAGTWERANLYNDFYIVPFAGNEATEMTVCVEYDIFDTDLCDAEGKPVAQTIDANFLAKHRVRSCKRISTLEFKDSAGNPKPIHFDKNQSRTLNIIINPNYIYTLFDHDEPATMIVK